MRLELLCSREREMLESERAGSDSEVGSDNVSVGVIK